jgi:ribosomal protein L3 glutamine methyltransferase
MRKAKLHAHFFGNNSLQASAQYLACFTLNLPYEHTNDLLTLDLPQALSVISVFEHKITNRLPVEYITKEAWYLGHKFYVNEHVLIPRSLMSTRFNDFLNMIPWKNYRVLDLCTGSGCIGISLALLNPHISVDLVDLSLDALDVAVTNIKLHGLEERVRCIHSDLFTNIHGKYDLIISNPPYVSRKEYKKIPPEFKHEPKMALESGKDGLDAIHQILTCGQQYLNPQGKIIARSFTLKWLNYRQENPSQSWFSKWLLPLIAMDCIFILEN